MAFPLMVARWHRQSSKFHATWVDAWKAQGGGAFVVPNRTNMVRHAPSASLNPVHPAAKVRNATEYVLAPPFVAS
ncbi:hypothetical protein ACOTE7_23175 [Achromobacter xylosoxidans]